MKRRAALNVFILTGGSESESWGGAEGDRNGQMRWRGEVFSAWIFLQVQKQNWKTSCSLVKSTLRLHWRCLLLYHVFTKHGFSTTAGLSVCMNFKLCQHDRNSSIWCKKVCERKTWWPINACQIHSKWHHLGFNVSWLHGRRHSSCVLHRFHLPMLISKFLHGWKGT